MYEAAWSRANGRPIDRLAPMAKLFACQTFRDVTAMAQQIFGGVGFTVEYDIQLYFRRAKQLQISWWDDRYLEELIATATLDTPLARHRCVFGALESVAMGGRKSPRNGAGGLLEGLVAEGGEDLGDLAEQVVAVGAGEVVDARAVPPLRSAPSERRRRRAGRSARTSASQPGSKKNGQAMRSRPRGLRTRCGVDRYTPPVMRSSMSPRLQTSAPGCGGISTQPSARAHLEAAAVVLVQHREQAVVGVLPHAPARILGRTVGQRRVVEHPEQDHRVVR